MSALTYRRARVTFLDLSVAFSKGFLLFIGIVLVVFLVIGMFVALAAGGAGDGSGSIWENSAYATRYFPLSMGIMITAVYLPVAVASGVTRRSFGLAAAGLVVAMAGLMAVLEAAGYLIEYGIYRAAGETPTFTTPHLFDEGYEFWIVVPEVWIVVAGNVAAGWLIGAAYYKWGWLGPTLALPLLLLPLLVVEAIMSVGWAGAVMENLGVDRLPTWQAIVASLAVLALVLAGIHRFVRTIDLRPQKA